MQLARATERKVARTAAFAAFAVLLSCHESSQDTSTTQEKINPNYGAPFAKPSASTSKPKNEPKLILDTGRGCPTSMARVEQFCIDRFEAYLVNMLTKKPNPYYVRPDDISQYKAVSEPGVFPQGYVSQLEAEKACANANKRLCTRAEWLTACTGALKEYYVYGPSFDGGKCGDNKRPHVMSLYFGPNNPSKYWTGEEFNDPIINATPGYLDRTGSHPECHRGGVYDLEGGLHEWNSDVGTNGMGTFSSSCYSDNDLGCGYYAQTHARAYHDYSTGIRCCADPKK